MNQNWQQWGCAALAVLILAGPVSAHGVAVVSDQIELAASAEVQVPNDLLVAVLFIEREGQQQAPLAQTLNETMAWALNEAKSAADIKVQTLQYTTFPVYAPDSSVISGWRARQSLRLEGSDAKSVGELIARLQTRLAIESVDYAVSRTARLAAEESLTAQALARFGRRAQQIATALGRPVYRLMKLNVCGLDAPAMPEMPRLMMARGMAKEAPAQLAAGTQNLSITVAGTVQLEAAP